MNDKLPKKYLRKNDYKGNAIFDPKGIWLRLKGQSDNETFSPINKFFKTMRVWKN